MKTPQPTRQSASATGRPATWTLVRWITLVLAVHLGVLMGIAGTLDWHLQSPPVIRTGPMQTRWVAPPVAPSPARSTVIAKASTAKTRVAQVNQAALSTNPTAPLPKLEEAMPKDVPEATLPPAQVSALDATQAAFAPQAQASAPAMVAMPNTVDAHASSPAASGPPLAQSNAPEPVPAASLNHLATPTAPAASAETSTTATKPPDVIATATMDLPNVALASLPPSTVVSYRLNGQEKGLNYQASGELRWQHNDTAYAMSLSVKAFLVGSRYWRSQGQITSAGLVPAKFSDSWRSERAAHFDHAQNRIVFSNNAPTAPLQPGAQDQISLYVQLAAAMAGSGSGLKQGTRLQIQTATIRDALPWLLTLEQIDTLTIDGQAVQATKWVCQPRNRFDAKVEFWVTAEHHWLPVRIRITQVNGSFIDLNLNAREPLPPLPAPPIAELKNHTILKWMHLAPRIRHKLRENEAMNLLYESETFAVMHLLANAPAEAAAKSNAPMLERHGFEIVDKRSGKEVYLDGSWAEMFQQQIQAWQQHTPTQEEVEDTLEGYTGLAQQPVVVH